MQEVRDKLTPSQRERQSRQHRSNGKYAKVHPCYRCGKSAGVDYLSVLCDETDSLGNSWHDRAICLCGKCATYLQNLTEFDPRAAWAEVTSNEYGSLPQGKPPKEIL